MRDRVADVLSQRAALDKGAGTAVAISLLLHVALGAAAAYAALHAAPPRPASMVSIEFASMPAVSAPAAAPKRAETPRIAEPEPKPVVEPPAPKLQEPKPAIEPPQQPAKVEKNTVPLSPFGRSTKKGAEAPAPAPPVAAPPAATTTGLATTTAEVPVGGTGITGFEGGDFPYALYIQAMHRKIGPLWLRPAVPAGTAAIVYFRVQRDGTIAEARIHTSSGNGTFDRAALSAIRSAARFNPLPPGYSGNYLGVHLTFK